MSSVCTQIFILYNPCSNQTPVLLIPNIINIMLLMCDECDFFVEIQHRSMVYYKEKLNDIIYTYV